VNNQNFEIVHGKKSAKVPLKYMGYLARYSDQSKKVAHHICEKFLLFLNEINIKLGDVDQDVVNIYCDRLHRMDVSNGTCNLHISYVRAFLSYLGNDFTYKRKEVIPYSNTRIISKTHLFMVIRHLRKKDDWRHKRDCLLISMYYFTALRKTEVLRMKHRDIVFDSGNYFYKTTIKGGAQIRKKIAVPLYERIQELKEIEKKDGAHFIFTSKKGGPSKMLINSTPNRILNKYYSMVTGLSGKVTVHGIRNQSLLSVYKKRGNDSWAAKHHANHKNWGTTQMYLEKVISTEEDNYDILDEDID